MMYFSIAVSKAHRARKGQWRAGLSSPAWWAGHPIVALAFFLTILFPTLDSRAQIGESRKFLRVWDQFAVDSKGFVFESVYPATGSNGCLSPPGTLTLPLEGGSVQVSLSSGECPIRDGSSSVDISDAHVPDGQTLRFVFNPPIKAFMGAFGSVAVGEAMSMRVISADGQVNHTMEGQISASNTRGTINGFNSRIPIRTIEFSSSEAGTSVLGDFVGLDFFSGQDGLPNCRPSPGAELIRCDFLYAFDTSLPDGMLLLPDGNVSTPRQQVVDIDLGGDTAVVSIEGRAYVYERNGGGPDNWGVTAKLEPPAELSRPEQFGSSVAISGDDVVVGAPSSVIGGFGEVGRVFVYNRNAGGPGAWGRVATLSALIPQQRFFGASVDIDGDILATAEGTSWLGVTSGYLSVFEREGSTWSLAYLYSNTRTGFSGFGADIAVGGNTVLVGENQIGDLSFGLARFFGRNSAGDWEETGASGPLLSDGFGTAVDLQVGHPVHPDYALIGGPAYPGQDFPLTESAGWAQLRTRMADFEFADWSSDSSRRYFQIPLQYRAAFGSGVAIAGSRIYISAPTVLSQPASPPRVFAYPLEAESYPPAGAVIRRPDGSPLDDVQGPIAADGRVLLVPGKTFASWIIDIDSMFSDSFEP